MYKPLHTHTDIMGTQLHLEEMHDDRGNAWRSVDVRRNIIRHMEAAPGKDCTVHTYLRLEWLFAVMVSLATKECMEYNQCNAQRRCIGRQNQHQYEHVCMSI